MRDEDWGGRGRAYAKITRARDGAGAYATPGFPEPDVAVVRAWKDDEQGGGRGRGRAYL